MNGNVICLWSPGDNDLLRVLDEDSFPTGTPVFTIRNNGQILQRGAQIHADYVFEADYQLESVEEHAAHMMEEKHLKAIPRPEIDENGHEVVEVNSLMRDLLEELEKAHLYIAGLSKLVVHPSAADPGRTKALRSPPLWKAPSDCPLWSWEG